MDNNTAVVLLLLIWAVYALAAKYIESRKSE